jgi:hypothetical protein
MSIHSPVLGAVWFIGIGFALQWFRRRGREADAALKGYEGSRPSQEEADGIRVSRIFDGFIAGGAIIVLFALLAWLESLFSNGAVESFR